MKKLSLLSFLAVLVLACASTPALKDYQPRSPEEEKIVSLFLDFQKAVNSYDYKRALRLYSPSAKVWTVEEMDRTYTKRVYSGDELKIHLAKLYPRMRKASLNIKFSTPKNIYLEENAACMTLPYRVVSTNPHIPYVEKGTYYAEFTRGATGWSISQTAWQIEYCNDEKWKEYKRKHTIKNIWETIDVFSPKCKQ